MGRARERSDESEIDSKTLESSDDVKHRLRLATRDVVANEGWSAATSRTIARSASTNPALINYYFGGKDALMLDALESCVVRLESTMDLKAIDEQPAVEWILFSLRNLKDDRSSADMRFLFEASLRATRDSVLAAFCRQWLEQFVQLLSGALLRDIEAGRVVLRNDDSPEQKVESIARGLTALADGLAMHSLLDPDRDPEVAIRAFLSCFFVDDSPKVS